MGNYTVTLKILMIENKRHLIEFVSLIKLILYMKFFILLSQTTIKSSQLGNNFKYCYFFGENKLDPKLLDL
jgi:hypothetical protein